MISPQKLWHYRGRILLCCLLGSLWETRAVHIHYSIPEEMEKGSFVGDIAKDLGLEPHKLSERGARIVSGGKQHFALNVRSGSLITADRIDREKICLGISSCLLNVEILMEDKVKIYGLEIEVTDINDNAPRFRTDEVEIKINENAAPGIRFGLPSARDPDIGVNSLQSYQLSQNNHFSLNVLSGIDGAKYPELVLERALDREEESVHQLILKALDGGDPGLSGTARIRVLVLDANDNAPVFTQSLYSVSVRENVPKGKLLLAVNATDSDEGVNGEVTYSFRNIDDKASEIFQLNSRTGELILEESLDYEESKIYEMEIQGQDGGGLLTSAKVLVRVLDVNDNPPEVTVTSSASSIPENSPPGTVIALLKVHDRDSGNNGHIMCSIHGHLPFKLEKSYANYYSLVTDRTLDREQTSMYNVTVTAIDQGTPLLSTNIHISLQVEDTNDNPPSFSQKSYSAYIPENNPRGSSIYSVTASDSDTEENARITYSITDYIFYGASLSSYISINSETGVLYALCSFDYEQFRDLQLQVTAKDWGDPPLSSNVSLTLFILDQNDNAPEILYPTFPTDGSTGVELAPRSAEPGYLVTKVVVVDADSGQNAWLSYRLLKVTEPGLFSVDLHTGEIRTARTFHDKDSLKQILTVAVSDNGEPPLSATVSVTVAVADSIPEILSDLSNPETPGDLEDANLTLYLVIAVAVVSSLFFVFIIVLLVIKLRSWRNSQLLQSSSGPPSQFMGLEGVQAFLQTYSHEVSLTMDSRKSQLLFPQPNYADTLISQQSCEKKEPLLIPEDSRFSARDPALISYGIRAETRLLLELPEGDFLLRHKIQQREEQHRLSRVRCAIDPSLRNSHFRGI
ncbi:protocadherin gamma-A12-like [Gracilinanus agilis]|uniref:protocadherin gamma-A12-like n=1 Tax=Gracilinanus agilis TaxID=191870 RepID=UPI001CFDBD59|nr:protocadherin gamma-A12-like [Gracilinanus agilis]